MLDHGVWNEGLGLRFKDLGVGDFGVSGFHDSFTLRDKQRVLQVQMCRSRLSGFKAVIIIYLTLGETGANSV
jgi:hypothetical protein